MGLNGIGKEYYIYSGKLIYEGEYLNKKRNGKGKEYYSNGQLKFEGKYINGKKNGKGKEYYRNGRLNFEGEYLNGLKWNGKVYNPFKKNFSELKDGKGFIKEYYRILKFEHEDINGERNGKGKEYDLW